MQESESQGINQAEQKQVHKDNCPSQHVSGLSIRSISSPRPMPSAPLCQRLYLTLPIRNTPLSFTFSNPPHPTKDVGWRMPGAFRSTLLPPWEEMGERTVCLGGGQSISGWVTNHTPCLGTGTIPTLQGLPVSTSPNTGQEADTEPRTSAQHLSPSWPNHNNCPSTASSRPLPRPLL